MNKDQVKGAIKEVAGKVQQKAGKILGSLEQEAALKDAKHKI